MNRRGFLYLLTALGGLYALQREVTVPSKEYKIQQTLNSYQNRLYTPTQITKLYGTYFIVDCWHHRILYSNKIDLPLSQWQILDDNLAGPHSITSDGKVFVTEDTGRHAIKVYSATEQNQFQLIQTLPNIGIRPHRVLYDQTYSQFLIIGSSDQSFHILDYERTKIASKNLTVVFDTTVAQLNGQYCRSITLENNLIYFIGVRDILCFELKRASLGKFVEKIELHPIYQGSNDLFFTKNGGGLLTGTPGKIVAFRNISELKDGTANDLSKFYDGTPYYISSFDNKMWVPEITEYSAVSHLSNKSLNHEKREKLFDFGPPSDASLTRKDQLPT